MALPDPLIAPLVPAWWPVRSVRRELADTVTLEIEPPPGGLVFEPGQFTMLSAFGIGEIPISISGDPGAPHALVQTIRSVGPVSSALTALRPGDRIGVRGPFGNGWPLEDARGADVLVVAGGIGLAPLRPVLYTILTDRDAYGRVSLLYGARSPSGLLYLDEIRGWMAGLDIDVLLTVDRGEPGWHGSVGVVTDLIRRASFEPAGTTAFVCGPEIMMRFTKQALESAGVDEERIAVSMERNMACGVGLCGHCQFGPFFVCKDGPVFRCSDMVELCWLKEV